MSNNQRSTALYSHPFCAGYWRDAVSELKNTKMLVIAAMIIALRVALKTVIRIPLGPNLDITPAFLANALGAMIYGPVVGAIGAMVSDFLGVMLRGDSYFLPYVLTEIAGTMIFSLFFYRQKVTPTRVVLSRFCICLFVNILLQTPIDMLYQKVYYGYVNVTFTLPRIFKNLFMFPLESVVLSLFLSAIQPVTYRMKLTHHAEGKLSFTKKQVALLVVLVLVGIAAVFAYLPMHYSSNSYSASYSTEERIEANKSMQPIVLDKTDDWDDSTTMTCVESAYGKFLSNEVTYTVAIYTVADGVEMDDNIWKLSKSKAAAHESLTREATAVIVVDDKTGQVLSFDIEYIR